MSDSTADWSVMTQAQKDAALRSARAQGMREAAEIALDADCPEAELEKRSEFETGILQLAWRSGHEQGVLDAHYLVAARADAIERGE